MYSLVAYGGTGLHFVALSSVNSNVSHIPLLGSGVKSALVLPSPPADEDSFPPKRLLIGRRFSMTNSYGMQHSDCCLIDTDFYANHDPERDAKNREAGIVAHCLPRGGRFVLWDVGMLRFFPATAAKSSLLAYHFSQKKNLQLSSAKKPSNNLDGWFLAAGTSGSIRLFKYESEQIDAWIQKCYAEREAVGDSQEQQRGRRGHSYGRSSYSYELPHPYFRMVPGLEIDSSPRPQRSRYSNDPVEATEVLPWEPETLICGDGCYVTACDLRVLRLQKFQILKVSFLHDFAVFPGRKVIYVAGSQGLAIVTGSLRIVEDKCHYFHSMCPMRLKRVGPNTLACGERFGRLSLLDVRRTDRVIWSVKKAHKGNLTAIDAVEGTEEVLVTSGWDGFVRVWRGSLCEAEVRLRGRETAEDSYERFEKVNGVVVHQQSTRASAFGSAAVEERFRFCVDEWIVGKNRRVGGTVSVRFEGLAELLVSGCLLVGLPARN